jgi:glycosyltransferase involved in cell wall biosynthesis
VKIVHIEDFIHPEAGYQVNLLSRLQVRQGHDVVVVTAELDRIPETLTAFFGRENIAAKDEAFHRRTGVRILRVPLIGFYSGRAIFSRKLFGLVDSLKPDVAFIHGEDTLMGIQFIMRARKLAYPIVLDCHMIEMASENRLRHAFRFFYRYVVTPRILKGEIPLIRVVDVDYVEKCLGIPLAKTILLSFGTDTDYFRPDEEARREFRKARGIDEGAFVVLYAGKLDASKGGQFFAESIRERIDLGEGKSPVFVVVGNAAGEYGKEVEALFSASQNRVLRFPTQPYLDLVGFYQAADLALYPRQCSLSFFEAQSCGLPVLLEDNEINVQRVRFKNGLLFAPEDIGDVRAKIRLFAEMGEGEFRAMKDNARKFVLGSYDYVPIARKFTDVLENEVAKFRERRGLRGKPG